ncbi:MAG: hypothetical protein J5854_04655 [Clostridia bacterium]|nr:hypothetical protein [Clostridia bacterium]
MLLFAVFCFVYDVLYLIHSLRSGRISSAVFAGLMAAVSALIAVLTVF